ncbi:MAG TPA: DUF2247 family protein [Acidobacteriaceae bacterium]|nr:DUF2247 family protein [Acidobacteriaceae bacterium]
MKTFQRLKDEFPVNWATILAGWRGLGAVSPWPERWTEFPSLLTAKEIEDYAFERLESAGGSAELSAISDLAFMDISSKRREEIASLLVPLSESDHGDLVFELRKWRLAILQETLENLPSDAVGAVLALTEFWNSFGFPSDAPREAREMGSSIRPAESFQQANVDRLLLSHREWAASELAALKGQSAVSGL